MIISVPKHLVDKVIDLKYNDQKELAIKANNLEAFQALTIDRNYELTSELLGIKHKYVEYMDELLSIDLKDGIAIKEFSLLKRSFDIYLMCKVCFPDEL